MNHMNERTKYKHWVRTRPILSRGTTRTQTHAQPFAVSVLMIAIVLFFILVPCWCYGEGFTAAAVLARNAYYYIIQFVTV